MRQIPVVLLITAAFFMGITWFLPDSEETDVGLQRPKGGEQESKDTEKKDIQGPIDLRSLKGSYLFSPHERQVQIEGKDVRYVAAWLWCRSMEPGAGDSFRLRDVRILFNSTPRTRKDLEGLIELSENLPPRDLGDLISRRMENGNGILATEAIFHGGSSLGSAARVDLVKGVRAVFSDPRDPNATGEMESDTLTLLFKDGSVTRISSSDPVRFTGGMGTIMGTGLSVDRATGQLVLERDIDVRDLQLSGQDQPPMNLLATGPLTWIPESPGAVEISLGGPGRLRLEGAVSASQPANDFELKGDRLWAEVTGSPARLRHLQIEGDAQVLTPLGQLKGALITYTIKTDTLALLEVSGEPVTFTIPEGNRFVPGSGAPGPLVVSTAGTVRMDINPMNPRQKTLSIAVGPDVTLSSSDLSARALGMEVVLERTDGVAPSREPKMRDVAAGMQGYRPKRARLAGGVIGEGPQGGFACGVLLYERITNESGELREDLVRLSESPSVSWALVDRASKRKRKDSELGTLLSGAGRLALRAADLIEIHRDPLETGPLKIQAVGDVHAQRFGKEQSKPELATLDSRTLDLTLLPGWNAELFPETGPGGFRRAWSLEEATALGAVLFEIGERANGSGSRLHYNGSSQLLTLEETGPKGRARMESRSPGGRHQVLWAPDIKYRLALRRIEARRGVEAQVIMPPVTLTKWRRQGSAPVQTRITGQELDVTLPAPGSKSGSSIEHLLARSGVQVKQENAEVRCEFLESDLVRRQMTLHGTPVRIDSGLKGSAEREFLQARSIIGSWKVGPAGKTRTIREWEVLLRGDVEARFLVKDGSIAMKTDTSPRAVRSPVATGPQEPVLVPIEIHTAGEAFLSSSLMLLDGPSRIVQGEPKKDGFLLEAQRMAFFLLPSDPAGSGRLRIFRAVATGLVDFTSPNLLAKGERMVFDAEQDLITLEAGETPIKLRYGNQDWPSMPGYLLDVKKGQVMNFDPKKRRATKKREGARR